MVHTMRDRLPNLRNNAWNLFHVLANFVHDGSMRPAKMFGNDVDLALIDACGVLIEFCSPGAACCGNHFRSAVQNLLHLSSNTIGFFQRSAWRKCDVDVHRALVEWRKEFTPHQWNK